MGMMITKQTRIPDVISEKFKASYGDQIKKMGDRLEEEVLIQNALEGVFQWFPIQTYRDWWRWPTPHFSFTGMAWWIPLELSAKGWTFQGISVADFEAGNSLLEENYR